MNKQKPRIRVLPKKDSDSEPLMHGTDVPSIFGPNNGLLLHKCDDENRRPGDCDIILHQSVYQQIVNHLSQDTSREHGGLLLGYEVFGPNGKTVVITHAIAAPRTEGTPVRLTFTHETWSEIDRITDQINQYYPKIRRLGWYHSHPDLSIFLSNYDLDVCSLFSRPTHLALVVDPIKDTGGFFVRGREGYRTHSPQGFWELQDVQSESIVTWKNMRKITQEEKNMSDNHQPYMVPPHSKAQKMASWTFAIVVIVLLLVAIVDRKALQEQTKNLEHQVADLQGNFSNTLDAHFQPLNALPRQTTKIEQQITSLQRELNSLESRFMPLNALVEQTKNLEQQVAALRDDLKESSKPVQEISSQNHTSEDEPPVQQAQDKQATNEEMEPEPKSGTNAQETLAEKTTESAEPTEETPPQVEKSEKEITESTTETVGQEESHQANPPESPTSEPVQKREN